MKVVFIGLGIMGSCMVKNLFVNGVDFIVYNCFVGLGEVLQQQGVQLVNSVSEVVVEVDIVFSMLFMLVVVWSVFFGGDGVLYYMKVGSIWVDCIIVNFFFSKEVSEEVAGYNIVFVDILVAGIKLQVEVV